MSKQIKKIAYFLNTFPKFANTFIDEEIETLCNLGIEIVVFSMGRAKGIEVSDRLKSIEVYYLDQNIPLCSIVFSHLLFAAKEPSIYSQLLHEVFCRKLSIKVFLKYFWVLKEYQDVLLSCDLFHAHFIESQAVLAKISGRILNRPYTMKIHGSDVYEVRPNSLDFLIRDALCCFTVSKDIQFFLKNSLKIDYGNYIQHSCGTKIASYSKEQSTLKDIDIICVGRMFYKKGIQFLIESVSNLVQEFPNLKVVLIGDGYHLEEFRKEVLRNNLQNTIEFMGPIAHQEVYKYYNRSKIFVLPSLQEGLGMVFLEAMSCYLPVVGAKVGGVPEIITNNYNGFLVPPENSNILSAKIKELLLNPEQCRIFGLNGRKIAEKFELSKKTKELLSFWEDQLYQQRGG